MFTLCSLDTINSTFGGGSVIIAMTDKTGNVFNGNLI